jgi:hypothetical protein
MNKLIVIILFLILSSCSLYEKDIKIENKEIKDVLKYDNFTKCIEKNKNKFKNKTEIINFCINNDMVKNNTDNHNYT